MGYDVFAGVHYALRLRIDAHEPRFLIVCAMEVDGVPYEASLIFNDDMTVGDMRRAVADMCYSSVVEREFIVEHGRTATPEELSIAILRAREKRERYNAEENEKQRENAVAFALKAARA